MAEKIMTVQVRQTQVRATPSFLGKIVARISYGEKVSVVSTGKTWLKVRKVAAPSITGWVHGSALAAVKVTLRSGGTTARSETSTREVSLAGKGFTENVENGYAVKHPDLDFSTVDRMEKISPSMSELEKFARDGNLNIERGTDHE